VETTCALPIRFHTYVSRAAPNVVTSIGKRSRGAVNAQPVLRGEDTEVRRQESDKGDATPNLFLKHRNATLADVLRQMKHLNKHLENT
jgi:hypothetical protein